jgi:hypothetical protein
LSNWVAFSDSQFHSGLMLLSLVLGSLGIYGIVRRFCPDWQAGTILLLAIVPFYFLNLWSVGRITHTWIWFTYAIFPLFIALGISYAEGRRTSRLVMYSLLMSFFGFLPHSFMYLAMIHGLVVAYGWLTGTGRADLLKLALVPVALCGIISIPPLALLNIDDVEYPISVTADSFTYLSRYGNMLHLLTSTNMWWPPIPVEMIHSNWAFRYSSYAVFVAVFSVLALSYGGAGRREKAIMLISLACILGTMFIAQGDNNALVTQGAKMLIDAGFSIVVGPFREWARISLLIPVFMAAILSAGVGRLPKSAAVASAIALIMFINMAVSPGWAFMKVQGAVIVGGEFETLKGLLPMESKTVWSSASHMDRIPAKTLDGIDKTVEAYNLPDAGDQYGIWALPWDKHILAPPRNLLDVMNVRHVVDWGGNSYAYWWMECRGIGNLTLCSDKSEAEPFGAYEGTVVAARYRAVSVANVPLGQYALCEKDCPNAKFAVMEPDSPPPKQGQRQIYIIEAEGGMSGDGMKAVPRAGASNSTVESFEGTAWKDISIARSGTYRLAVAADGEVQAYAGGRKLVSGMQAGGFAYSEPFYLPEGDVRISVGMADGGELDVIWLYEDAGNTTLEGIFSGSGHRPASITSYERISPTSWEAKIQAGAPFMLTFAEGYDWHWVADVYENGNLVDTLRPVRMYGVTNGYWVNRTGDLDVEFRYEMQDGFAFGVAAAAALICACFAYLGFTIMEEARHAG